MKTLLLIRHAKSSHDDPRVTDHDRPLNERGRSEAPEIGKYLLRRSLVPEQVLSSSAQRARETAGHLATTCGYAGEVDVRRELYLAAPDNFIRVLRTLDEHVRCVAVVAHNPGLEEYASQLVDRYVTMPTSTVVEIELDLEAWSDLLPGTAGRLSGSWRPKDGD